MGRRVNARKVQCAQASRHPLFPYYLLPGAACGQAGEEVEFIALRQDESVDATCDSYL
jgi:hypothetical protein